MDYTGRSDYASVPPDGQDILPQLRFQQHIGSYRILFSCESQHKCQDAKNFCSAGDSCHVDMADESFVTACDQVHRMPFGTAVTILCCLTRPKGWNVTGTPRLRHRVEQKQF